MSQNIQQIYVANPITTNASTDLMYFGQSPYGSGNDAAMTFANFNAQIVGNGTANQIGYYATTGNKISGITSANNGVLITSNSGVPSWLANGTAGYVLTANTGAPPSWQAASATGAVLLAPAAAQTILTYPLNVPGNLYTPAILDSNGSPALGFVASGTSVNYINVANSNTGVRPAIQLTGSNTDIGLEIALKNAGTLLIDSKATTNQVEFAFGAGTNLSSTFNFASTSTSSPGRVYTFPDATGTIALAGSSSSGYVLTSPAAGQTISGAFNLTMSSGSLIAPTVLPGNLSLTGNTISSTDTNGLITLIPDGNGIVTVGSGSLIFPLVSTSTSIQVAKGGVQGILRLGSYVNGTSAPVVTFSKSRSTTIGSFVAVQNGDSLGSLAAWADDGTQLLNTSQLLFSVSGSVSTGIVPTQCTISTANTSGVRTVGLTLSDAQILTLTNPLPAGSGGTGVNNGALTITLSGGSAGKVLTSDSSGNATWQAAGGGAWVDQSTATVTMATNTGYTANAGASLITFTLPTTSAVGDFVEINGKGSGGWIIAQAAGQQIQASPNATTSGVGGSLASTAQYNNVRLRCLTANTLWTVVSQQSAGLTVV